jgi:hypothetical protein
MAFLFSGWETRSETVCKSCCGSLHKDAPAGFKDLFGHDLEIIHVRAEEDGAAETCRFQKIMASFGHETPTHKAYAGNSINPAQFSHGIEDEHIIRGGLGGVSAVLVAVVSPLLWASRRISSALSVRRGAIISRMSLGKKT